MAHAGHHHHHHARPHHVGFSLLRLSAGERLVAALVASAALWGMVVWATAA